MTFMIKSKEMKITQEHVLTLNLLAIPVTTPVGGWVSLNSKFFSHQPTQPDKYKGTRIQVRPENKRGLNPCINLKKFKALA